MFCLIPITTETWQALLTQSDPLSYAGHEYGDPVTGYMQSRRNEKSGVYEIDSYFGLEQALRRLDTTGRNLINTLRTKRGRKLISLINERHHCFRDDQMQYFQDDISHIEPDEVKRRADVLVCIPEATLATDPDEAPLRDYIRFYQRCSQRGDGLLIWNLSQYDFLPN